MAIKWFLGGFATLDRNVLVPVSDLITKLCVSLVYKYKYTTDSQYEQLLRFPILQRIRKMKIKISEFSFRLNYS